MKHSLLYTLLFFCCLLQANCRSNEKSVQVIDDTVNFSFSVSGAASVKVAIWGINSPNNPDTTELGNIGGSNWEATIYDVPAGFYYYTYLIDEAPVYDRATQDYFIGKNTLINAFEVIADADSFMIRNTEPFGNINACTYKSEITNEYRQCYVYTPYIYDINPAENYPVLYLLSDSGENATAWFIQGRLLEILDNAIIDLEVEPMLIVMECAQAYADPEISEPQENIMDSVIAYELVNFIDSSFHTRDSAKYRAIAGCSAGGAESIDVFLKHNNLFNNLGVFSLPAGFNYDMVVSDSLKTKELDLLFMGAGSSDESYDEIIEWHNTLLTDDVEHTWDPHEGNFNWLVWRKNLYQMIQQLFISE